MDTTSGLRVGRQGPAEAAATGADVAQRIDCCHHVEQGRELINLYNEEEEWEGVWIRGVCQCVCVSVFVCLSQRGMNARKLS